MRKVRPRRAPRTLAFDTRARKGPLTTRCRIWKWGRTTQGYGTLGEGRYAHRFYYERTHGPVPVGLELDHLCRVRLCVNPDHLEAVTSAENSRRSPRNKLTKAQIVVLREYMASRRSRGLKLPGPALAAAFGISGPLLCRIEHGQKWHGVDLNTILEEYR